MIFCYFFSALEWIWVKQCELWRAWIEPLPNPAANASSSAPVMQPWTESDSTTSVIIVEEFKSSVLFVHAKMEGELQACPDPFIWV